MNKLIGNTPMIKIRYTDKGKEKYIYVKLEMYNITGSIKDRMAHYIIKKAKEDGALKEKMPIIEATSGNTGISFAALGAYYNHPVYIFMPDWASKERKEIIESYGAKIYLVSKEQGGFKEAIKKADKLAEEIEGFRPNQFSNKYNLLAQYYGTGEEIIRQFPEVDSFVSGIGTGGTLMGVGKRIKEHNKKSKIYGLEPEEFAMISKGQKEGKHRIEGIGDDFIPELFNKKYIEDIVLIKDTDAIEMAQKISRELGIGVGISSGANLLAAMKINKNNKTVTIFVDDNKKYMSTDLSKSSTNNLKEIKLLNFETI